MKNCLVGTAPGKKPDAFTPPGLFFRRPIVDGIWENGHEDIDKVFGGLFYEELHIQPENQPLMLMDSLPNARQNLDVILQHAFEKFKVPALCIVNRAVMSLYATGSVYGLKVFIT